MNNDFGFVIMEENDKRLTRHQTYEKGYKEAFRLAQKEGKTFYLLAPIRLFKPSLPPVETHNINWGEIE